MRSQRPCNIVLRRDGFHHLISVDQAAAGFEIREPAIAGMFDPAQIEFFEPRQLRPWLPANGSKGCHGDRAAAAPGVPQSTPAAMSAGCFSDAARASVLNARRNPGSEVRSRLSDARNSIRLSHTRNGFGPCLEGVFTDIQVAQLALAWREHGGSERQLIVVKIEKIGQTIQVRQRVRYASQACCVQDRACEESSSGRSGERYFRQIVVGQDQGFEPGSFPHPIGNAAEPLLP